MGSGRGVGWCYASERPEKWAQEEEIGGDRSLGVLGAADALRLESTPSMCTSARDRTTTMCVNAKVSGVRERGAGDGGMVD